MSQHILASRIRVIPHGGIPHSVRPLYCVIVYTVSGYLFMSYVFLYSLLLFGCSDAWMPPDPETSSNNLARIIVAGLYFQAVQKQLL